MASLWKDPRTKYWVACFTDTSGRRLKKTTHETNRKKAQQIADDFEKVAKRQQTVKTVRQTISTLASEIWGVDLPTLTVRAHVDRWLGEKKSSTEESTVDFYEKSVEKFLTFLGKLADQSIEGIERNHIADFKTHLAKSLAPKTVNHHIKCLRMIFKAARRDGLIDDDPAEFVDTIKKEKSASKRAFTVAEIKLILEEADEQWRSMILCGLYTGQRLADIASLNWQNIDLPRGEIRLTTRKTQKLLTIPIAPPLQRHFESLPSNDNPSSPLHPQACQIVIAQGRSGTLSNQFTRILVSAGLRDKSALDKHKKGTGRSAKRAHNELSFHSLRHTAVTLLKEAGIPHAVVQELIGHDSEQMSKHYTHVGREALRKAADALPSVEAKSRAEQA